MAKLIGNQKRALEALLTSPSVAAAARRCGLNPRTVWRYLESDEFKARLRERQDQAVAAVSTGLVSSSSCANEALLKILDDLEAPTSVRARVGLGLLAAMRKQVELEDLAGRVAELERLAGDDD